MIKCFKSPLGIIFLLMFLSFILLFIFIFSKNPLEDNLLNLPNFSSKTEKKITLILGDNKKEAIIEKKSDDANDLPLYFSIKNISAGSIEPVIVVNQKGWSSLSAIIETALPERASLNDEEKVIRLSQYLSQNAFHSHSTPGEGSSPITLLNIFGYGLCSDFAYALAMLGETMSLPARIVYLNDHIVVELFYGGGWHMFDPDRNVFYRKKDGMIASVEDIFLDKSILRATDIKWLEAQQGAFAKTQPERYLYKDVFMDGQRPRELAFGLKPNEEIRFYYDWKGDYLQGELGDEPEEYSNGLLITKINVRLLDDKFYRKIQLPYPILNAFFYQPGFCWRENELSFSLDKINWHKVDDNCQDNIVKITNVFPKVNAPDISKREYYLEGKVLLPFDVVLLSQFQVAPKAIPQLNSGDNRIAVKNIGNEKVEITFAFRKN